MGKSKKPFIQKEKAQKFVLVHRSLTDAAHAGEEEPSQYVFVPSNELASNAALASSIVGGGGKRVSFKGDSGPGATPAPEHANIRAKSSLSHINELGFKNDGYDYAQHLKEMGGGYFVSKDGSVTLTKQPVAVKLPAEALPSDLKELERDLQAITISHEFMDSDLRDALFSEEEGLFEELDDNFVIESLKEPEKPDFDFDAHIARLIQRSERSLQTFQGPRGWDEVTTGQVGQIEEGNDDDDDDDDEEEEEDLESYIGDDQNVSVNATGNYLDDAFEKTLAEYDDDELGDAPYAEEEDIQGKIDDSLDDDSRNRVFDAALDEYLEEEKLGKLATGVFVQKGCKIVPLQKQMDDEFYLEFNKAGISDEVKFRILAKQAEALNESFTEMATEKAKNVDDDLDILTCQEYLRDTRPEEKWDCETILSTYSLLDNHPTTIVDTLKPVRKSNGFSKGNSLASINCDKEKPSKIVLSGKFSMPITYVSGFKGKLVQAAEETKHIPFSKKVDLQMRKLKVAVDSTDHILPLKKAGDESHVYLGDDESSTENCSGSDEEIEEWEPRPGLRKETPDERRARKAIVKAERRQKRITKKNMKEAYNSQSTDLNQAMKRGQHNISGVSVFKY